MKNSRRKRSAKSVSNGQPQNGSEKNVDEDENESLVKGSARNGTRSASTAFGDDSDQSVESPVRKKQNTATSIPNKLATGKGGHVAKTSINEDNKTSANGHSRDPSVGLANGSVTVRNGALPMCSIEEKKDNVLDIAPPTSEAPTRTAGLATASNIMVKEKLVGEEATILKPQITNCGNNMGIQTKGDASVHHNSNENGHTCSGAFGWAGVAIFMNLFVFSWVVWTGLLLNESSSYQLDSLECRERLHQTYQAMGLDVDFEDMFDDDEENYIRNHFKEQEFYWQELEGQVQYWKKEAKKYQRYGDAYREQCQEDLRHLLSEVDPQKADNQNES